MEKIKNARESGLLTEKESEVMQYLLEKGYYAEKYFSDLTARDIALEMGVDIKSLRGVIGSLIQKDYLFAEYMEDIRKSIIYATDKGYMLDDDYENR
jgi:DNA-binding MarR family transcriptional regulator